MLVAALFSRLYTPLVLDKFLNYFITIQILELNLTVFNLSKLEVSNVITVFYIFQDCCYIRCDI